MTKTATKTVKTSRKTKAPAFDVSPFFNAGLNAGHADAAEIALVKGCPVAEVEKAQTAYVLGYITSGLVAAGEPVTDEHRKQAQAILDGVNPEAKTVPEGKMRRSAAEHALARAGARRFNRARNKAGIVPASNIGGARERGAKKEAKQQVAEAKPVTKVEGFKLQAKDAKDAASKVHTFREGFVHFLAANKELAMPDEARALSTEIIVQFNKLEKLLAGIKVESK